MINYTKLDSYINQRYKEKKLFEGLFKDHSKKEIPTISPLQQHSGFNPLKHPKFGKLEAKLEKAHTKSDGFVEKLLYYINLKKMTNAQVYNKAGIKPDCFSKIISGKTKRAEKNTVISLIFALQLNLEEAEDLLESAQYALLDDNKSDIIIRFCLENSTPKDYCTIDDVNKALAAYNVPLIGGVN